MSNSANRRIAPASKPAIRLRRRLPLPVLLGLMLVAGLCALLALNTASAAQEIRQRNLTESNATSSDVEQQLLRDLAARQAPAALASAAASLGLVPNPNPAFLRINPDGSVTVLGQPTPATVPPPPPAPTPAAKPTPTTKPSTKPTAKPTAKQTAKPTKTPTAKPTTHPTPSAAGGH
jgi:outer membrane biosynthesis protein TonB